MTKLIIVIICLLLIISSGVIEQLYIRKTFNDLIENTDSVLSYLENNDFENASIEISKLQDWWYIKRDWLEFLCPNNDIKEIAREIGELQGSILSEAEDDPKIRCNVLKEMAKNSMNLLAFKWKNIL